MSNLTTFKQFRQDLYQCMTHSRDALFNLSDALLTFPSAHSLAELSLSPYFTRKWSSLYSAIQHGHIDRDKLRQLLVKHAPLPQLPDPALQPEPAEIKPKPRVVLGVDSSAIERAEAYTSADRTCIYVHNLPNCANPTSCGWQFSTLMVVPQQPSSWSYTLDNTRIPSTQTATTIAASQLQATVPLLPNEYESILCADRHYGSATFVGLTKDLLFNKLLRVSSCRVFYRPAPAKSGKAGGVLKDGNNFKCNDLLTQGHPDETWRGFSHEGSAYELEVSCWHQLHFKKERDIELSLYRVSRPQATDKKRDPKVSWFIWVGVEGAKLALEEVWSIYRQRYSMEHTYRYAKQDLLWSQPKVRSPEQFEIWTDLVTVVSTELNLGRELVNGLRQPWEKRAKEQERAATPRQVRREIGLIVSELGSEAKAVQVRGKGVGRAFGAEIKAAMRHPVVRKAPGKLSKKRQEQRDRRKKAG